MILETSYSSNASDNGWTNEKQQWNRNTQMQMKSSSIHVSLENGNGIFHFQVQKTITNKMQQRLPNKWNQKLDQLT